jgi:hypothetical protein
MAEAVAGETGKPFVFVDPGGLTAFGFGALAVKGVFRKLRKLAVRYGGVIVFFDEADSLGNRGQLAQGGVGAPPRSSAWSAKPPCNGLSFVDPSPPAWSCVRRCSPVRTTVPEAGGTASSSVAWGAAAVVECFRPC